MGRWLPTSSHFPATASWRVCLPFLVLYNTARLSFGSHVIPPDKDLSHQNSSAFKTQTIIFLLSPKHISIYFQITEDFLLLSPILLHLEWSSALLSKFIYSRPGSSKRLSETPLAHIALSLLYLLKTFFSLLGLKYLRENNMFSKVKNFFSR